MDIFDTHKYIYIYIYVYVYIYSYMKNFLPGDLKCKNCGYFAIPEILQIYFATFMKNFILQLKYL